MSAPLRLSQDDRAEARAPSERRADPIAGWLDVLTRMLPAQQGAEVREELEEHVRERVRDLVLAGQSDAAATRAAIAELGDAAAVAQRFREAARIPKRRLAMNIAVLGVAGAALMTSVVGVMRPGEGQPRLEARGAEEYSVRVGEGLSLRMGEQILLGERSVRGFEFQPAGRGGGEPAVPPLKLDGTVLSDALDFLAQSAGASLVVRWNSLAEGGIQPDTGVEASAPAGSLSGAFEAINSGLAENSTQRLIDFRLRNGVLEVARPDWFDRRELTLIRYDLSPIEAQGIPSDEFMAVVRQFVSPEDWLDNGGSLAQANVLGRFAFVKGPPRIHEGVRWFLAQFTDEGARPAGADPVGAAAPRDDAVSVYHIQHTDAQDLLQVLMSMPSIREVDFTPWVADPRTNSIIGKAPAAHHRMVGRAIKDLDNPEAVLKRKVGQRNAEQRAMLEAELAQVTSDRKQLEDRLAALGGGNEADAATLRDKIQQAAQREEETRARIRAVDPADDNPVQRGDAGEPSGVGALMLSRVMMQAMERPLDPVHLAVQPVVSAGRIHLVSQLQLASIQAAAVPPPITRALLMAHSSAEAVAGALRAVVGADEQALSIEVDAVHNTVILRGEQERVLAVEEAAWKLDHVAGLRQAPPPQ